MLDGLKPWREIFLATDLLIQSRIPTYHLGSTASNLVRNLTMLASMPKFLISPADNYEVNPQAQLQDRSGSPPDATR
jgi:hypothetical protein